MGDEFRLSDVGTEDQIDALLAEYGYGAGLLSNETDALLAALLQEQKAARLDRGGERSVGAYLRREAENDTPEQTGATYYSASGTVDADGWTHIKPGFVSQEVDLRFDGAVKVAYTASTPSSDGQIIEYAQADSPVVGTRVKTGNVWLRADNGPVSVDVEVWA